MVDFYTIGDLFKVEPSRWGLRGDPFLWLTMRMHFANRPLPSDDTELRLEIESAFESLTGHQISEERSFYVEQFAHGGMSSGQIDPEFWRKKALPLLLRRHSRQLAKNAIEDDR